jgi:hypothetical protein
VLHSPIPRRPGCAQQQPATPTRPEQSPFHLGSHNASHVRPLLREPVPCPLSPICKLCSMRLHRRRIALRPDCNAHTFAGSRPDPMTLAGSLTGEMLSESSDFDSSCLVRQRSRRTLVRSSCVTAFRTSSLTRFIGILLYILAVGRA